MLKYFYDLFAWIDNLRNYAIILNLMRRSLLGYAKMMIIIHELASFGVFDGGGKWNRVVYCACNCRKFQTPRARKERK